MLSPMIRILAVKEKESRDDAPMHDAFESILIVLNKAHNELVRSESTNHVVIEREESHIGLICDSIQSYLDGTDNIGYINIQKPFLQPLIALLQDATPRLELAKPK
jgi:hypothetical protein